MLIVALFFNKAEAQIIINNPSCEDFPDTWKVPHGWSMCEPNADVQPVSIANGGYFTDTAFDGKTYVGFAAVLNNGVQQETFSQFLNCNMIPNKQHKLELYSKFNLSSNFPNIGSGELQIWGGYDTCTKIQLLWTSPTLTNPWKQYTATFIPDEAFTSVIFVPIADGGDGAYLGLDNLSDIKVLNYKFVQAVATTTDSLCYQLLAQGAYDNMSYSWQSMPNGFSSNQQTNMVCPTINTTYIVTATTACGSIVSDTIFIKGHNNSIKPTTLLSTQSAFRIQNDNHTIQLSLNIYNTLGQLIYQSINYQNDYRFIASGMYYYQINNNERGKVLVVE